MKKLPKKETMHEIEPHCHSIWMWFIGKDNEQVLFHHEAFYHPAVALTETEGKWEDIPQW